MKRIQTFKDRLVDELKYHDISFKIFAQKIGISIGTLNMYLYRGSMPAADVAVRMAKVLNTSVEYLVTGETQRNSKGNEIQLQEIMSIAHRLDKRELQCFSKIANAFKDALEK